MLDSKFSFFGLHRHQPYDWDDDDPYNLDLVGEPPSPLQEESDPNHQEPPGRHLLPPE